MRAKLIVQLVPAWWGRRTPALVTRAVTAIQASLKVEAVTVGDDGLCLVVEKPMHAQFRAYDGIFVALQGELDTLSN